LVNPAREPRQIKVTLGAAYGPFQSGEDVWGGTKISVQGRSVTADIGDRDAAAVLLK
jgi:hypothetical protein